MNIYFVDCSFLAISARHINDEMRLTEINEDELDLPYIYWIPKMHKHPYKHRFIAGLSNF